jgi:PhnB protein
MHACIKIGDSNIFISDIDPKMGSGIPSASSFYVYVDDVDTTFRQAEKAGFTETYPIQEMFWGDRMGAMVDSFGIQWTLATHVRDVSQEEMEEAKKNFMKAA